MLLAGAYVVVAVVCFAAVYINGAEPLNKAGVRLMFGLLALTIAYLSATKADK